jgi:hypothetical protein
MTGNVPEVVRFSLLNIQVCVPADYTDEQVEEFANRNHPTGIDSPWKITEQLGDDPTRNPCSEREGMVHIVLEC